MTAVDTNVLVRIVTNDDESKAVRAAAFLAKQDRVFVARSVLLELEWVLRKAYSITSHGILVIVRDLMATGNVEVEGEAVVAQALVWYEGGMDFADALHLASAGSRKFATFDAALRRAAHRLGAGKVAAL